jgi:hypothetical protein
MPGQPMKGISKSAVSQMHDQVDGPTPADTVLPVDKLAALNRQNAIGSMPFSRVVSIGLGLAKAQDRWEGNASKLIDLLWG